jgi:hypothetical protein
MKAIQDEQFKDIKQLITTTASQLEQSLKQELANKQDLSKMEARLTARMDDGFAGGSSAVDTANDHFDQEIDDLKTRVTRIEATA